MPTRGTSRLLMVTQKNTVPFAACNLCNEYIYLTHLDFWQLQQLAQNLLEDCEMTLSSPLWKIIIMVIQIIPFRLWYAIYVMNICTSHIWIICQSATINLELVGYCEMTLSFPL